MKVVLSLLALLASFSAAADTYVFEGESTTMGTGKLQYDAWPERLARKKGWGGIINAAVGSQTIEDLSNQYAEQVQPHRPKQGERAWLYVMIGIKDIGSGRTARQTFRDIGAYLSRAKQHGFTTVALTTWPNSERFGAAQLAQMAALRRMILAGGVADYCVDAAEAVGIPPAKGASALWLDPVHPSAEGYDRIAAYLGARF